MTKYDESMRAAGFVKTVKNGSTVWLGPAVRVPKPPQRKFSFWRWLLG